MEKLDSTQLTELKSLLKNAIKISKHDLLEEVDKIKSFLENDKIDNAVDEAAFLFGGLGAYIAIREFYEIFEEKAENISKAAKQNAERVKDIDDKA